jgi:hypothetical protein
MVGDMETQTVNLSFRYSERDYVEAMHTHYASRLRLPLDVAIILALTAFGIYELHSTSKALGLASIALAVVFALILTAAFFVIPAYAFRREPKFRDDYSLAFSGEGIHFRTANIDSQLQWSMYDRALLGANSILLYHGKQQFTVIPKRVFATAEQLQVLENLVREHVPNIVVRS